ncbi:MAG: hypothetical protein HKO68_17890 [Desulfobacterales bacterium]|nr:hypothetical protein [Desulfobacterales bacterium]
MRKSSQHLRQRFSVDKQIEVCLAGHGQGQINITFPMTVKNLFPIECVGQTIN